MFTTFLRINWHDWALVYCMVDHIEQCQCHKECSLGHAGSLHSRRVGWPKKGILSTSQSKLFLLHLPFLFHLPVTNHHPKMLDGKFLKEQTLHFRLMTAQNCTMKPHAVLSQVWVISLSTMPTLPAHESLSNCLSHQVICCTVTVAVFLASFLYFIMSPKNVRPQLQRSYSRERQISSAVGRAQDR